jgi:hypothetical protein
MDIPSTGPSLVPSSIVATKTSSSPSSSPVRDSSLIPTVPPNASSCEKEEIVNRIYYAPLLGFCWKIDLVNGQFSGDNTNPTCANSKNPGLLNSIVDRFDGNEIIWAPVPGPFGYNGTTTVFEAAVDKPTIILNNLDLDERIFALELLLPACTAPSSLPSVNLTLHPTSMPSDHPTSVPSDHPTLMPSDYPTLMPSDYPTLIPSDHPTLMPSDHPTLMPSDLPSVRPDKILPTKQPSPPNYRKCTVDEISNKIYYSGLLGVCWKIDLANGEFSASQNSNPTCATPWIQGIMYSVFDKFDGDDAEWVPPPPTGLFGYYGTMMFRSAAVKKTTIQLVDIGPNTFTLNVLLPSCTAI